jgi:hypothetical protein
MPAYFFNGLLPNQIIPQKYPILGKTASPLSPKFIDVDVVNALTDQGKVTRMIR